MRAVYIVAVVVTAVGAAWAFPRMRRRFHELQADRAAREATWAATKQWLEKQKHDAERARYDRPRTELACRRLGVIRPDDEAGIDDVIRRIFDEERGR